MDTPYENDRDATPGNSSATFGSTHSDKESSGGTVPTSIVNVKVHSSNTAQPYPWLHKMTPEERSKMLDRDYVQQLRDAGKDDTAELDFSE